MSVNSLFFVCQSGCREVLGVREEDQTLKILSHHPYQQFADYVSKFYYVSAMQTVQNNVFLYL